MISFLRGEFTKYFSRVIVEEQGLYTLLLLSRNEEEYIVCISRGSEYIYGKIARADTMPWLDCRELEYDPRGLYVFARDPREFVEKTLVKMEKYRL